MADLTAKIAWIAEVDFTGSPRDYLSKRLRGFPYTVCFALIEPFVSSCDQQEDLVLCRAEGYR